VGRGALVEPSTLEKEPGWWLRRELAVLDVAAELEERVMYRELNERLERLGIRANLKPLARTAARAAGAR